MRCASTLKQSVVHSTAKPGYVSRQQQGWVAPLEAEFALDNKRNQKHCCSAKNQRLSDVMHVGKQQAPPFEHPHLSNQFFWSSTSSVQSANGHHNGDKFKSR